MHGDDLIDVLASKDVECIGSGFGFTEGPAWDRKHSRLIFSDMKQDHMRSWDATNGIATFRKPSNKTNGNTFNREGDLLSCEHSTSRVIKNNNGKEIVLASHYRGKELNSPNDIIVGPDSSIYFTDPTYGRIREDLGSVRPQQLQFQGVYKIPSGSDELQLIADDFEQPNGLCLSLDGKRLFVNDTARMHIRSFDLSVGKAAPRNVWADLKGTEPGVPDGMKIDSMGRLFCTGPGGIHVFDQSAHLIGVISIPERPANFAWGEADGCSLFVTATTSLYKLRTKFPGPNQA